MGACFLYSLTYVKYNVPFKKTMILSFIVESDICLFYLFAALGKNTQFTFRGFSQTYPFCVSAIYGKFYQYYIFLQILSLCHANI